MITAQEARALSDPTPQERVDDLEPLIRTAIHEHKRHINLHDAFWVNGGYSGSADYKLAKLILEGLGYKVKFYYKEHSIAVDMYTVVEW